MRAERPRGLRLPWLFRGLVYMTTATIKADATLLRRVLWIVTRFVYAKRFSVTLPVASKWQASCLITELRSTIEALQLHKVLNGAHP